MLSVTAWEGWNGVFDVGAFVVSVSVVDDGELEV